MPDLDDVAANAVTKPASAAQDGRSATAHPIPDQLAAVAAANAAAATTGTNANGGARSPWNGGVLRAARAQTEGA